MDILWTLFKSLTGIFASVLLLRACIFAARIPPFHPLAQALLRITLRPTAWIAGLLPPKPPFDRPALITALVLAVLLVVARMALAGLLPGQGMSAANPNPIGLIAYGSLLAVVQSLEWLLQLGFLILLGDVLMGLFGSSPQAESLRDLLSRLAAPLLKPIRARLNVRGGGFDFSPLVAMLAIQAVLIANTSLEQQLWKKLLLG